MSRPEPSSPGAIFLKIVDRIEGRIKKAKRPRAFKDEAAATALRGELFRLEGWAKIHRHWPNKKERKIFEQIRTQTKTLEDAFGEVDVCRETAEDLLAKGQTDLAKLFDAQGELVRNKLKHILKSKDWFAPGEESRTDKMRQQLTAIEWPSTTAQVDYLILALVNDLHAFGVRYRTELKPKLLKSVYDRKILENDLHKFRRQLRWFSMYFQTADGLIRLGPVSDRLTAEKRKLIADYKENEFANLPTKKIARAQLDTLAFYELTRLIEILCPVKDQAERYFNVRDLLIKNGVSDAKATERVRLLYGDVPTQTPIETQAIMQEYERLKPLSYLAESLSES
jgi:hypothetical protein